MTSFLSSIADKAQSAIQPLAQHMPGAYGRSGSPTAAGESAAGQSGAGTTHKSHTLEALQHQIRAFGQQYSSTTPVQKIITSEKGVALDYDSLSRDAKGQSKEFYTWGQNEAEDVKDVTDRLAYLNFVQGSLAATLATKLDAARTPLKTLRDAENTLAPRRTLRTNCQNQIARIEHDMQKGMEKKLAELKAQLKKAEEDDEPLEKELQLLKRKAVGESETLKWAALREYGEKLSLLSQASEKIISVLPPTPPSVSEPYTGAETTASVRAFLQHALDTYQTGHVNIPLQASLSDLSRSDTRSFGETHASELSSIHTSDISTSNQSGLPVTPPADNTPQPSYPARVPSSQSLVSDTSVNSGSPGSRERATPPQTVQSPPLNPALLNQAPATIPIPSSSPGSSVSPAVSVDPISPSTKVPAITPTVAETGVPVAAGADGPGPSSGSLLDLKSPRRISEGLPSVSEITPIEVPGAAQPTYESAADEKKRLEREYRERILNEGGSNASGPGNETAEEEKKRLEREERERILRGETGASTSVNDGHSQDPEDGEELPPYQDGF